MSQKAQEELLPRLRQRYMAEEKKRGGERCWMRFMSSFAYSRKDAIKLMGAKAG